jgi:hydrogenase maturation protein HypF
MRVACRERRRLRVKGAVQGVGFRPYVFRLASELGLAGWVENTTEGVAIEVEGASDVVAEFQRRLPTEQPPRAWLRTVQTEVMDATGGAAFTIRDSGASGARTALVLPDIATCAQCLHELLDPSSRRYRYPFINCTQCGPRYSIILDLPYDRARTTMRGFTLCRSCRAEYADPSDRRFHAEPNACPACGPQLQLWDGGGHVQATGDAGIDGAVALLREGGIVAVKGLGGFHLMVDARDEAAVRELRRRKRRDAKPLAVMVRGLDDVERHGRVTPFDAALLVSAESPIVIVPRRVGEIAPAVAPGNPELGLLLPYTPVHHLLMREAGFPVVATSGNVSDEPLCTDESDAVRRLAGIADAFLVHDRPIARPVDDSVVRVVAGRPMLLRRARGYAPLPVASAGTRRVLLAVGAHLKNTVALSSDGDVVASPHVGDLGSLPAVSAFEHTIDTMRQIYALRPEVVVCDRHPDYASSRWAHRSGRPVILVQHHYAHVLATLADNEVAAPVLGIAWDGTGDGGDGTIWGGEALHVGARHFARVGSLRQFPLPGGERAVREPRRTALGLLWTMRGDALFDEEHRVLRPFSPEERVVLRQMLARGVSCPRTSSMGRLFDGVAALTGLHAFCGFEGQAAMALEHALDGSVGDERYPFGFADAGGLWVLDWGPLILAVCRDVEQATSAALVSLRFHNALAEAIVSFARAARERRVVLAGGCFQNRYLTERAVLRLRQEGFEPFWSKNVPPNDGGISVGQIVAGARTLQGG